VRSSSGARPAPDVGDREEQGCPLTEIPIPKPDATIDRDRGVARVADGKSVIEVR
jgi:hypothetical protein